MVKDGGDGGWNPYLAGALAGVVVVLSVVVAGKYVGASTSFVRSAGMLERIFSPEHVSRLAYFLRETPKVEWQWMFVLGIMLGSFISAVTSGSFRVHAVPDMWRGHFGGGVGLRAFTAFVGGAVLLFGARLAGG
jgi:hypothetical protein